MNSQPGCCSSLLKVAASSFLGFVALGLSAIAQNVANIQVSQPVINNPIPNDFLGWSVELSSVSRFFGSSPASNNAVLIALAQNLGQGTFRIGGNSQDEY
jgi:hypothetical protein